MQLLKGLFVAAVLCMATVSAGNHEQQQQQEEQNNGNQYQVDTGSSSKSDSDDGAVQQGFNVHHVNFAASDPEEEKGEEKSQSSAVPLIAAVGACACIGVLGAVYLKRRKEDDKLPGEIFTIDDKSKLERASLTSFPPAPPPAMSSFTRRESVDSSAAAFQAAHKAAPFASKHPKGFGEMVLVDGVSIEKTFLLPVPNLRQWLPEEDNQVCNRRKLDTQAEDSVERKSTYNKIMGESDVILGDIRRNDSQEAVSRAYVRAGPRENTYFDPAKVKAAIVTCGGLCPGLNNVVRDVTLALWNLYGVREIYGIRMGFAGFYNWTSMDQKEAPIMLTPKTVANIHHYGGTILGSNRGGFDVDKIINFLTTNGVSQVYVIGGDGTHRAANKISEECSRRKLAVAVAGVPKTIDNDVDLLDRSFGFNTAVEEAQRAIRSASTEARCVPNGIGVVKLMGRSAGFIAAHASLSSGDVNLCLIPEIPIELDGPRSCLDHLERVVEEQGHGVVVVAEGAGEELLGTSVEADAGGNKKLPPIGAFMKDRIQEHFAKKGKECTVKYIDPSYMIRSVPANAADSLYCMLLGQNAVHGAMAGYTGFTVGLSANRVVYFPIEAITRNSPRCMDPFGRTWERVLCLTRQPNTAHEGGIKGAKSSD